MTTPTLSPRELALQADTDVLGYIKRENAKRDAQAKAEGWSFWTLAAECVAKDYDNVYDYLRDGAHSTFSDVYKEINNFRPRWDFSSWSLEDFERETSELFLDQAMDRCEHEAE